MSLDEIEKNVEHHGQMTNRHVTVKRNANPRYRFHWLMKSPTKMFAMSYWFILELADVPLLHGAVDASSF